MLNNKGFGLGDFLIVVGLIGLISVVMTHTIMNAFSKQLERANAKGYLIVDDLSKYSVKLIETRKSTDENWVPVNDQSK